MTIIDNIKSLVTGKSPAAQLAQIRDKIAAGEAELKRLDEEIGRRALPIVHGDTEAAKIAADCRREKGEIGERLAILREAEGRLAAKLAAETAAAKRAELAALPRRRAEMLAEFIAGDRELRALFQDAGDKLRVHLARADALAAELGGEARRVFGGLSYPRRFRSQLAHHFHADSAAPGLPHTPANNLLGLEADRIGADYWREIDEIDGELFDNLCPLYLTEVMAQEALHRRAARNLAAMQAAQQSAQRRPVEAVPPQYGRDAAGDPAKPLPARIPYRVPPNTDGIDAVVARCGEVFPLLRHDQLFGSREEAERAMQSGSLWREGGYAVIDWPPGAAIVRADLAEVIAPIATPAKAA